MKLFVTITEGKGFPSRIGSICSPYILMWIRGSETRYRTSIAMHDSEPNFSESAMIDIDEKNSPSELALVIQLWQKDEENDDDLPLSSTEISLSTDNLENIEDSWISLTPTEYVLRGGSVNIQYLLTNSSSENEIKDKYQDFCSETGSESQCVQFTKEHGDWEEMKANINTQVLIKTQESNKNEKEQNEEEKEQDENNNLPQNDIPTNDTTPLLEKPKDQTNNSKEKNKKPLYVLFVASLSLLALFLIVQAIKS